MTVEAVLDEFLDGNAGDFDVPPEAAQEAARSLRLAVLAELRQTAARLGVPPLTVGHLLAEYESEHCHG